MSLHQAIMNLPHGHIEVPPVSLDYRLGHRDARHAAAELGLEADKKLAEQTLTLAHMAGHVADLTSVVGQQTAEISGLRAALSNLLDAESAEFPTFDDGVKAQDEWEKRSEAARDAARAALEPKP
jgi:hypothetical protein